MTINHVYPDFLLEIELTFQLERKVTLADFIRNNADTRNYRNSEKSENGFFRRFFFPILGTKTLTGKRKFKLYEWKLMFLVGKSSAEKGLGGI